MRLALDHHLSPLIAVGDRDRGYVVRAVSKLDLQFEECESLVASCSGDGLALGAIDVVDFVDITQR